MKYFSCISMFETSLKCRLANCSAVYKKSEYLYLCSSAVVVLSEQEVVVSGVLAHFQGS